MQSVLSLHWGHFYLSLYMKNDKCTQLSRTNYFFSLFTSLFCIVIGIVNVYLFPYISQFSFLPTLPTRLATFVHLVKESFQLAYLPLKTYTELETSLYLWHFECPKDWKGFFQELLIHLYNVCSFLYNALYICFHFLIYEDFQIFSCKAFTWVAAHASIYLVCLFLFIFYLYLFITLQLSPLNFTLLFTTELSRNFWILILPFNLWQFIPICDCVLIQMLSIVSSKLLVTALNGSDSPTVNGFNLKRG